MPCFLSTQVELLCAELCLRITSNARNSLQQPVTCPAIACHDDGPRRWGHLDAISDRMED